MGAWHATYANLLRSRFGALVAYAELLTQDRGTARDLAQDATVAVFARRRSPRDTQEAEMACRKWMAAESVKRGVPEEHAAAVRFAMDGVGTRIDDAEVVGLRRAYADNAAVYATPTGGTNTVMAPARVRHRNALASAAVGVIAGVAVLGVAGWGAMNYLPVFGEANADGPTASASPSSNLVAVTWNPQPDLTAAMAGFHWPECGERFAPSATSLGGVTPKPSLSIERDADYGIWVMLSAGFTGDEGVTGWVLTTPYSFVVTLDDEVVYTTGQYMGGVEGVPINVNSQYVGGTGMQRVDMCDKSAEMQALADKYADVDWNTITAEEQQEIDDAYAALRENAGDFPAGTYKIYQVSPVIFGEQSALAQVFEAEGVTQLGAIDQDIAWTELAQDPRMVPYCTGSPEFGDMRCDAPADVLKDVLTRQVDPATINDTEPGIAISAPVEYTVDPDDASE